MKNLRKIITMVLALMMVLSLAVTAFAAESVSLETPGHTYKVYQIFSGEQTATDATLSTIKWGANVNGTALLAALKADLDYFDAAENASGVAAILADKSSGEAVSDGFANIAVKYVTDPAYTTIAANATSVTLDAGYYLFVDSTANLEEGDAYNPALLQVTKAGVIRIQKKYTVPEINKKVYDGTKAGVELVDSMMGETVTFQLESTLGTGIGHYDKYQYIIHDDLDVGLDLQENTIKVYLVPGGDIGDNLSNKVLINPQSYTVSVGSAVNCEVYANTCDLEINFADLKQPIQIADGNTYKAYTVSSTDHFFVTYDVTVTEAAKVWLTEELVYTKNKAKVEFSNDPNWTATPDDDDDTNDVPPTGVTPESDAKVYTTQVTIEKVDASKRPLTGAKFQLSGKSLKTVVTTTHKFEELTGTAPQGETIYWLLTDGTYTSTDPNTNGIDQSAYASTTTKYVRKDVKSVQTAAVQGEEYSVTAEVGEDGLLVFTGLAEGTYTLTEIEAPAGYDDLLEDIILQINFNAETEAFTYSWRHENSATVLSSTYKVQIVNTKGSVLPETGGMGTTIFYALGGLMVMGAAVLLITKKRMTANN